MSRNASIYVHVVVVALCLQLFSRGVISDDPDAKESVPQDIEIITRKTWWTNEKISENFEGVNFPRPPDYIVLSNTELLCGDNTECKDSISKNDNSMKSNFYIGSNGKVYEGRGWDLVPGIALGGLEEYVLSVMVLGDFTSGDIPTEVTNALNKLPEKGKELKKLSGGCKYIDSSELILSKESATVEKLYKSLREEIRLKGDDDINLNPDDKYPSSGIFPIVMIEEWNTMHKASKNKDKNRNATKLVIKEHGNRCFSDKECIKNLLQCINDEACEGKGSNFYIGDSGLAYEGKGWYENPSDDLKELKSKALVITFLGSYKSYGPSKRSILALERLIKFGLWLRTIDYNYNVITIGKFETYKDKEVGVPLSNAISKFPNYSANL